MSTMAEQRACHCQAEPWTKQIQGKETERNVTVLTVGKTVEKTPVQSVSTVIVEAVKTLKMQKKSIHVTTPMH